MFPVNICFFVFSPLPVVTPEGTIGFPSVRPSVCQSASPLKIWIFDNLKTIKARGMKLFSPCLFSCLLNSGSFDNLEISKVRRMQLDT